MAKAIILYYSGVGSTRLIAQEIQKKLDIDAALYAVNEKGQPRNIELFDYIVFAFPCYNGAPAPIMLDYIKGLSTCKTPKKAAAFVSYGFAKANTERIFAKHCAEKNIQVLYSAAYCCPAVDAVLKQPDKLPYQEFEKGIHSRITSDTKKLQELFAAPPAENKLPAFHVSGVLLAPKNMVKQRRKQNIYLDTERCARCGRCVKLCRQKALKAQWDEYPVYERSKCAHCYKCIHLCIRQALSLSKKKAPQRQLSKDDLLQKFEELRPVTDIVTVKKGTGK